MTDETEQCEIEGGVAAAAEGAQNEDEIREKITRFDGDEEENRDWRDCLTSEMPSLILEFHPSSEDQLVNLNKEEFEQRLVWCSGMLGIENLPAPAVDELFELAVQQCQQMAAFRLFKKTLDSTEFNGTLKFLQQERKRVERISKLLQRPPGTVVPRKLTKWEEVWVRGLRGLVEDMGIELRREESRLTAEKHLWMKSGRTQLESHLLSLALASIRAMLKRNQLQIGGIALLVAYGHASQLAKYEESPTDGEPVEAMKVRMSRTKKSGNRVGVLSLFLSQLCRVELE